MTVADDEEQDRASLHHSPGGVLRGYRHHSPGGALPGYCGVLPGCCHHSPGVAEAMSDCGPSLPAAQLPPPRHCIHVQPVAAYACKCCQLATATHANLRDALLPMQMDVIAAAAADDDEYPH